MKAEIELADSTNYLYSKFPKEVTQNKARLMEAKANGFNSSLQFTCFATF